MTNLPSPQMTEAFCSVLNNMLAGWSALEENLLRGPGGATVRLLSLHNSESEGHVDVEIVFESANGGQIVLTDCVVGSGATHEQKAQVAAHRWAQTTAAAAFELYYSGKGLYATHLFGADADGFTGWHSICGGLLPYGDHSHGQRLVDWWLCSTPLPTLSSVLDGHLDDRHGPYGLKILFGIEDIAEVRVGGEVHEKASSSLQAMDWPRGKAVLRTFLIPIHRDCACLF
jgi:hypothetical protein